MATAKHEVSLRELLHNLLVTLDQLLTPRAPGGRARIMAQGAVEGIAAELQAAPRLEAGQADLLADLGLVLGRLIAEAAERARAGATGALAEVVAEGGVRGAARQLEESYPELHRQIRQALAQAERMLSEEIAERQRDREPGERGYRARVMAEGFVRGAVEELQRAIPELAERLREAGPAARALAAEGGEALVAAIRDHAGEIMDAVGLLAEHAGRRSVEGALAAVKEELGAPRGARLAEPAGELVASVSHAGAEGAVTGAWSALRKPLLWLLGVGTAGLLVAVATRRPHPSPA